MSFASDVMAPGGGMLLIPFVRVVVTLLLICTVSIFIAGVARIHMAILSFLSAGLLLSIQFFESAYNKVKNRSSNESASQSTATTQKRGEKTD
mmetsp:Transcript_7344/g.11156  ORF Transcript_7344/g.11156 Transcript_7344/m.11156 type:complete len:93 (+) Transcript_7344:107-385(+)